jgi:FkbM family methyltransferase
MSAPSNPRKTKAVSVVREIWRRLIPVSLRSRVWERLGRTYFGRSSIKAAITQSKTDRREQPLCVQRLITILENNSYQTVYELIKNELNLDFKGFSGQDLIAYIHFNGKTRGFFVDIGAFDGIEISNTYALEQLGWHGICVEPIPEIYSLLKMNRKCHKYNVAISSATSSHAKFTKVPQMLGLSGLEQEMPERITRGLEKQDLEVEQIMVNTMTFNDIMQNHPDVTHIDFLSIDIEGGELDVLSTIDFGRYHFGLITIENNAGNVVLQNFMSQHGYVIFLDLGIDLMFVPMIKREKQKDTNKIINDEALTGHNEPPRLTNSSQ